jgi:hypothetical protein
MLALLSCLSLLSAPAEPAQDPAAEPEVREIVVEDPRGDWLFPGLDHPRVQAFFRSGKSTGPSMFDPDERAARRPLVRAGLIRVRGAEGGAERRAARRFARDLVSELRPALEACYVDVLQREDAEAEQLRFELRLTERGRGPFHLDRGQLGDVHGNACVLGVLEFAELDTRRFDGVELEIPLWFWLQTV